jgi:primosomal protein N' (replication factor Y)
LTFGWKAGREGRSFSYLANTELGLQSGDLVRVRLRGRSMNGLVVSERALDSSSIEGLQPVEALLQKAAVDPSWSRWLEQVALRCHLSSFRMLKAALPSGWLRASAQCWARRGTTVVVGAVP